MKKVNIKQLSARIARMDNPSAYNQDIIAAQTTIANLGRVLRTMPSDEAVNVINAIVQRAGK